MTSARASSKVKVPASHRASNSRALSLTFMPSTAKIPTARSTRERLTGAGGSGCCFVLRDVMSYLAGTDVQCLIHLHCHRASGTVSDQSAKAQADEDVAHSLSPALGPRGCCWRSPIKHWVRRTPPFLRILRRCEDVAQQRHEHRASDHVYEGSTGVFILGSVSNASKLCADRRSTDCWQASPKVRPTAPCGITP